MDSTYRDNNLQFLSGGGEMGALTRAKDWSQTSLGEPASWPQSLRSTLSIVLNSRFPMFLWWSSESICFYNDAYRPSLGENGKHPDILGMPAEQAWPEIWDTIKPLIDQVMSGGDAVYFEDQLIPIFRNGKMEDVYWTFSYSPVIDESGNISGVLVTCNETTEKINTLKKVEESEERFRTMAETSKILIAVSDETGHAVYLNKEWSELTGRPVEELLKFGWLDLLHSDDKDIFLNIYLSAFEKKETFTGEFRILSKDGTYRWLLAKGPPRFHADGTFAGYISSSIDITDLNIARNKINESEKRFSNIADTAPVLIWMAGSDKLRVFFNKEWLHFTGRNIEQEFGIGWMESIHPDDYKRCLDIYTTAFDKKEEFYMEYRLKRYDEKYHWISEKGVPRFSDSGVFEGYIGACMDIHERVIYEERLKDDEERMNVVIDASELGTWEFNLKTNALKYSGRYLEIFGYDKDSHPDHAEMLNHLHPDDMHIRMEAFKQAYLTGIIHYQARIIWNDKSIHWMEVRGKVIFDSNKQPEKMIGTIRDITEERQYQQRLQEREEKFRLLADSMPQHVWTADPIGNLNYFNESVYNYSGLTPSELNELGWLHIVHPEDKEENVKKWLEAVSTGNDFIFEHRFRRHDGEYRWQLSRAIPQKDQDGVIQMWVGSSTDIQDQKTFAVQLEKLVKERTKELKKSEERYHLMVEEVQDYAILFLNKKGIIENWNKGAEKIKGYTADEIVGKNFSVFYTEKDKESKLPEYLLKQAELTGKANQEGWRVRKNGSLFWASVVITAVHDEKNKVIGFSKFTHDLSEKKAADDMLKRNAAELEQKNIDLEKMNKELQSFTYISSHDLQEPLRKIQTFSSRIIDKEYENLSESGKDSFQRMQNAARRMQILIDDLLAYSRTNNSDQKKFEKANLVDIVKEVKEELAEEFAIKDAVIEIGDICDFKIIPFQFRQLLQNMFTNSIKFSIKDKPLHIKIDCVTELGAHFQIAKLLPEIKYHHITITDNGIGFEPIYREKIFEVFQRLHNKEQYMGTGIGLAIVKKIVENHHGIITASGESNKGATFNIYIPADPTKI